MPDERSRMEVSQALADQLGPAAAAALMECIPPFGWHEIATKSDLAVLTERMDLRFRAMEERFDAKFEVIGSKFEAIESKFEGVDARLIGLKGELLGAFHAETKRLVRWLIPTLFAGLAAMGAVAGGIVAVFG